jgi:hypothetical protein
MRALIRCLDIARPYQPLVRADQTTVQLWHGMGIEVEYPQGQVVNKTYIPPAQLLFKIILNKYIYYLVSF